MVNKVVTRISGYGMLALMLLVVIQVFMRYVMKAPLSWSEEVSRIILVWFSLIGSYIAVRQKRHLGIEAIRKWTGNRGQQIGFVLECVLIMVFLGVLVYQGYQYCLLSLKLQQSLISINLPKITVYAAFPIAGALMWIRYLRDLIQFFRSGCKVPGKNTEVL